MRLYYPIIAMVVAGLLGGCALVIDNSAHTYLRTAAVTQSTYDYETTTTTTTTTGAEPRTPPPPVAPPDAEGMDCGVFVLPPLGSMPSMIDLNNPKIVTQEDVEIAMAGYIRALRSHIKEERDALRRVYNEYLQRCG